MPSVELRSEIGRVLSRQGYCLHGGGGFALRSRQRKSLRRAHFLAKKERISGQRDFILGNRATVREWMINGADLSVKDISPKLIMVHPSTENEVIYKWWNHVWWSLPYEKAYGRQMRYIVWDEYHDAAIGLIGLQSPILSWGPRDSYLNIPRDDKDCLINQSMSIQRLGALPPYNEILGGKLVAMLAAGDKIRRDFRKKYKDRATVMRERVIPANLLFATTTGAFGKSSIYNRLKDADGAALAKYIGDSGGTGSFHIPNAVYSKILAFLAEEGVDVGRGYGHGPSRKMRLISAGMDRLGYKDGNRHGIKRAIYLFSYVKNLEKLISEEHTRPLWIKRQESGLTDFWKERWALPREAKRNYGVFSAREFLKRESAKVRRYG